MSSPDFVLTLGGIGFSEFEVPDSIAAGGAQMLQVHKYSGGARTVDAFGADDEPITWGGIFFDNTAEARCQQLDTIRKSGDPVSLTWSSFAYTVVIKAFKFKFERFYQIRYDIELEVVEDLVQPVSGVDAEDVDDTINDDFDDSNLFLEALIELVTLAQNIIADVLDLEELVEQIAAIFTTLSEMSSPSGATNEQIATLSAEIAAAQATALAITATTDAAVTVAGDPANFVSGNSADTVRQSLKDLTIQSAALANVFQLSNVLTRMGKNVSGIVTGAPVLSVAQSIPVVSSGKQQGASLTVSPGNMLFEISAIVYGDAAGWSLLAQANDLSDPLVMLDMLITIPTYDQGRANDGILLP